MKSTKLYHFLSKLSTKEWADFARYLADPSLGASQLYGRYLDALHAIHLGKLDGTRETFLAAIHREAMETGKMKQIPDWDGRHMNRHMSQMLRKLFDFWGHQHFLQDQVLMQTARLRALAERGYVERVNKELADATDDLAQAPWSEGAQHLHLAQLVQTPLFLNDGTAPQNDKSPLQTAIDILDKAYCVAALELASRARNADFSFQSRHQDPLWLTAAPHCASQLAAQDPRLAQQLDLYNMYKPGATPESHFDHAMHYLSQALKSGGSQNPTALGHVLEHLISYAGQHLQADRKKFGPAIVQLYGYLLDNQALLDRGTLSPVHYHNIAYQALLTGEYEKVTELLHQHQSKLPADLREATTALCLAQLHFFQRRYHEGLALVDGIKDAFDNKAHFELALSCRTYRLVLQIASGKYELGEQTALNFLLWIKRNQSSLVKSRVAGYKMFAQSASKIARWTYIKEGDGPKRNWREKHRQMKAAWSKQPPVHHAWLGAMLDNLMQ